MNRNVGLRILNCAAVLVMLGGCYDMLIPAVPSNLLGYLKVTKAEMSPHVSSLLLGILRALGGCLLAIGITALLIINGAVRRGELGSLGCLNSWSRHWQDSLIGQLFRMASAVVGLRHAPKPKWKLEEALEFLNGPDFFPAASDPAQIEFDGRRHFRFPTPCPDK